MSNIFNLNTLLQENTIARNLIAKSFPNETYAYSTFNFLREFSDESLKYNKELYKSLNEASSKAEENAIFAEFYNRYSTILDKYINQVNTMVSRFTITLDNLVDANMGLVNDQDILGCDKTFTCTVKRYKNLSGGKYPKFNPLEIYQKEFDFIGQLMQDLGPIANDSAKLEVIASVCNTFTNKMKNNWLEKCIEEITGEDDVEDLSKYSEVVMTLFTEEDYEMNVNKGTIFAMKEEISGYTKYKDNVTSIADTLVNDFSYIGKNIGSMFYRNKDNILPVRTETDGIQNRDYQLNTYGMNQLDIFMKAKTNQVSQMCSLYVIALSIMMDNIINYITQCKDVLEKVKDSCSETEEVSTDAEDPVPSAEDPNAPDDNETEPEMEVPDDENSEDVPVPNENESDDMEVPEEPELDEGEDPDNSEPNVPDDSEINDGPEDDVDVPEEGMENLEADMDIDVPEEPDLGNVATDKVEQESYKFECLSYALHEATNQMKLQEYIYNDVLKEANDNLNSVTGIDTELGAIDKVFNALNGVFNKFTELLQKSSLKQQEFILKQDAILKTCKFDGFDKPFKVTQYDTTLLDGNALDTQRFDYNRMQNFLGSEEAFVNEFYKQIANDVKATGSIKEAIMTNVVKNQDPTDEITAQTYHKCIDFIASYKNKYKALQTDLNTLKSAKMLAGSIVKRMNNGTNNNSQQPAPQQPAQPEQKQQESTYTTADMYFNEETDVPNASAAVNKAHLSIYFKVTSKIISAKMTAYNTIFKDYFNILNAVLKANGKQSYTSAPDNKSTAPKAANNTETK